MRLAETPELTSLVTQKRVTLLGGPVTDRIRKASCCNNFNSEAPPTCGELENPGVLRSSTSKLR